MTVRKFSGFTLIEMLIVVVILTVLGGMVMTMVSQAKRAAMKSSTLSIEKKVETALRLFKDEYATYPYQTTYPILDPNAPNQYFPNGLYYRVGTNISTTNGDSDKVIADVNTAKAQFAYRCLLNGYYVAENELASQPSTFTFMEKNIIMTGSMHQTLGGTPLNGPSKASVATLLNRMAQEWVTNAMIAGAIHVKGFYIFDQYGAMVSDTSASPVVTAPASANTSTGVPGWANDYLNCEMDAHYVKGNDILDAWHHPLIYICQAIPGIKAANTQVNGISLVPFDSRYYGLGPQGFDPTTGPIAGLTAAKRRILSASGRIRLDRNNAGDGMPTPADTDQESDAEAVANPQTNANPGYFPDASNLMQSDMRYYAAIGYETEFELWSAGYDGKFSYMRSDSADYDNICATDVLRGLK
jgi:prepilin-type N-terminal cleavage/methylation domain-containing protein